MRALRGAIVLLLGIPAFASGPGLAGAPSDSTTGLSESATRGHQVFLQYCAMCHGDGGRGDGELAAAIRHQAGVTVANLTDRERIGRLGVNGVRRVVTSGGAHTGRSNLMPAWGGKLTSRQIADVADFVVRLPDLPGATNAWVLRAYSETAPGTPSSGRLIFAHQCSACHGLGGRGDGPLAATLIQKRQVHPRNLTDSTYISSKTDADLFSVITQGGGPVGKSTYMPHWGGYLTPAQIKDLVSYVRSLSHTAPRP